MNAQVTNFKATSYEGLFLATEGTTKVQGEFVTNPEIEDFATVAAAVAAAKTAIEAEIDDE